MIPVGGVAAPVAPITPAVGNPDASANIRDGGVEQRKNQVAQKLLADKANADKEVNDKKNEVEEDLRK